MSKTKYETDIVLGDRYIDDQTSVEGVATSVHFYQFACERVNLEVVKDGAIVDYGFDAPRLRHIDTGKVATTTRTGGPERATGSRPSLTR